MNETHSSFQKSQQLLHMIGESNDNWPMPSAPRTKRAEPSPAQSQTTPLLNQEISLCEDCSRANLNESFIFNEAEWQSKKPFWFIVDYPGTADQLAQGLATENSSFSLLLKLAQNLKIADKVYYTFALKNIPLNGRFKEKCDHCIQNLQLELALAKPHFVACFGEKSFKSIEFAKQDNVPTFNFPSVLELQNHPKWRKSVWEQLLSNLQLIQSNL